MSKQRAGKEKEIAKASFGEGMEDVERSSVFGQYSGKEMISRLKGLAMDPCVTQYAMDNAQPLCNQIIRLKTFMALEKSEMPWRKRKLDQFVKDKQRALADLVLPKQQNKTKCRRRQLSQASSTSCLLNSLDSSQSYDQKIIFDSHTSSSLVTFDEALQQKLVTDECSFADDEVELNWTFKDVPQILDSDESVNGSNVSTPGNSTPNQGRHLGISDAVHNLNLPALKRRLEPSCQNLRVIEVGPSARLMNFIGDRLQRNAIPVGPRFQADIPAWDDSAGSSIVSDNSKWLGSLVWPIKIGNIKSKERRIGKGRPNSCSCVSQGSADCIKRHLLAKRLLLQCELGPAFASWKFDEMGEQVLESWSLKEQQAFESLLKKMSSSNGKPFWNRALKFFPSKSEKDIINYYFNVYIARRMSLQRSPSKKRIDTDDEEEDEARDEKAKYLRSS